MHSNKLFVGGIKSGEPWAGGRDDPGLASFGSKKRKEDLSASLVRVALPEGKNITNVYSRSDRQNHLWLGLSRPDPHNSTAMLNLNVGLPGGCPDLTCVRRLSTLAGCAADVMLRLASSNP